MHENARHPIAALRPDYSDVWTSFAGDYATPAEPLATPDALEAFTKTRKYLAGRVDARAQTELLERAAIRSGSTDYIGSVPVLPPRPWTWLRIGSHGFGMLMRYRLALPVMGGTASRTSWCQALGAAGARSARGRASSTSGATMPWRVTFPPNASPATTRTGPATPDGAASARAAESPPGADPPHSVEAAPANARARAVAAATPAILAIVRGELPELSWWVEWCYGIHNPLLFGGHHLLSQAGVQQGDPLGPLLFSLLIHRLTRRIDEECPDLVVNAWYTDDGALIGPRASVRRALDIIAEEATELGLSLNLSKCELW